MKKVQLLKHTLMLATFLCCSSFGFNTYGALKDSVKTATNEQLATMQVKRLSRELSLTKAQSKKLYDILLKRSKSMKQDHIKGRLNEKQIKSTNARALKDVESVLTTEQKALFRKQAAELKKQKEAHYAKRAKKPKPTVEDILLDFQ